MFHDGCLAYPKKTLKQIIDSGNDYIAAVKGNQPKLFEHLKSQFKPEVPMDVNEQTEQTRSRLVHRRVSVLENITGIDSGWALVQSLIRVERFGERGQQPFTETVFYISSLHLDAASFAERIRHHWHIENRKALAQRCSSQGG